MKKILFMLLASTLFVMCKTAKTGNTSKTGKIETEKANEPASENVIYSDKFKAATAAETAALLKELNATAENYSVLVLTRNYKGEQITVTSNGKQVYKDYPISNNAIGIAEKIRIDNTGDTEIYDNHTKKSITIGSTDAKKYKFIHVAKEPAKKVPFVIVYSNKVKKLK
ncbi:hypothetical protein ACLI09_13610 [Flavobacterium sp. RHBU_24]|uniref:hypothetical protein n=1 Tax=Flavobacterium sp. RHBU_24 TaxID=3391185 RepID=UPI003984AF83